MLTARRHNKPVLPHHVDDHADCVCPACGDPVFLKRGAVMVHHFAHFPNSDCRHGFGETVAHIAAKLAFYKAYEAAGLDVYCEERVKLSDGRYRVPDIMVKLDDANWIVIELQHSSIDGMTLDRRVADYKSLGLHQIWVKVSNALEASFRVPALNSMPPPHFFCDAKQGIVSRADDKETFARRAIAREIDDEDTLQSLLSQCDFPVSSCLPLIKDGVVWFAPHYEIERHLLAWSLPAKAQLAGDVKRAAEVKQAAIRELLEAQKRLSQPLSKDPCMFPNEITLQQARDMYRNLMLEESLYG